MVERPLADKRPFGPFLGTEEESPSGILEVRQDANPELILEVDEIDDTSKVMDLISNKAKFDIHDILIEVNEGEVYTREPATWTIQIIADQNEVDLADFQLIADIIENRYSLFKSKVSASIERDPDELGVRDPFEGAEFVEESTEVDR